MNQSSADALDDIGSISSASLEPPPTGSQDEEDTIDEEGANNNDNDENNNNNNNNNNNADRNSANPAEESNEDPPEDQKIREQTKPVATFKAKKTNIEYRLTQANRAYVRDPTQKRSKDVFPLKIKLLEFRKNLEHISTQIKAYQQANKELQSAQNLLYANIADISVESPLYDKVGKKLDVGSLSQVKTTETAAEGIDASLAHSMMSVHQVAQAPQSVLETEYDEDLVGYIQEWQDVVSDKVDKLIQVNNELLIKQRHYHDKLEKLQQEKSQLEAKGKEFGRRKREKLVRNEEKHLQAVGEYEEKASEVCNMIEQIVHLAWLDLTPLVQRAIAWEAKRYGNDDAHYADMFRTALESLDEEISKIEKEETAEDLEAALSIQKERNQFLKEKLGRLQIAISGDWETKNELFRKFDLM